jgi:tRNA 5-methylaminomethyl-2-thiouridine biosynthesis bifunctional protein
LHFLSVEKHPFSGVDLKILHARWPEFSALTRELLSAWPPLVRGFHRLHLDDERITLTLLFGDAGELLPRLQAEADAFYLDGFAPAKNPDLWSPRLFAELARLAAPDATLATYTVAGQVRNDLAASGFANRKRPGFAQKREMLVGQREGGTRSVAANPARRAIVLGAGLAGTCCAERLAARGWQVELIERHGAPAQEASGNPSAILRPVLNLADTAPARLSRSAFVYALQHLHKLQRSAQKVLARHSGILQLAVKADEAERLAQIIETLGLSEDFVRDVDAGHAHNWPLSGSVRLLVPRPPRLIRGAVFCESLVHLVRRTQRFRGRPAPRNSTRVGKLRLRRCPTTRPPEFHANGFDCLTLSNASSSLA